MLCSFCHLKGPFPTAWRFQIQQNMSQFERNVQYQHDGFQRGRFGKWAIVKKRPTFSRPFRRADSGPNRHLGRSDRLISLESSHWRPESGTDATLLLRKWRSSRESQLFESGRFHEWRRRSMRAHVHANTLSSFPCFF